MPKTSAGLLLFRWRARQLEVLLVHPGGPFFARKEEGAWSIPKGEAAEGEDLLAVARRGGNRAGRRLIARGLCPCCHACTDGAPRARSHVRSGGYCGAHRDCDPGATDQDRDLAFPFGRLLGGRPGIQAGVSALGGYRQ